MELINHPQCTKVIGAPSDMQEPACSALPCAEYKDEHGVWTVSFWKPSHDDLQKLLANGVLLLHVRAAGRQHPVVGFSILDEN